MKRSAPKSHGRWWPKDEEVELDRFLLSEGRARGRALLGMSRSGKSTWLKNVLLPHLMKKREGILFIDVDDEMTPDGKPRDGTPLGPIPIRVEAPDFEDWLRDNEEEFKARGAAVAVVPVSQLDDGEELAEQISRVAPWAKHRGSMHLFLGEMSRWGDYAVKLTKAIATGWLKEGVSPWFEAHGLRNLDIRTRTQLEEFFCFRHVDDADLRFLAQLCGRGFALEVATLPDHHFRARDRREVNPDLLSELSAGTLPVAKKEK